MAFYMGNWVYNPFFSGVMGPYLQLVGAHLVTTFSITFESHVCICWDDLPVLGKSTLKIDRYCALVMQGFSNFLGLFQVTLGTGGSPGVDMGGVGR